MQEQPRWPSGLPLTARWALPLCCLRVGAAASLEPWPWPAAGRGLFPAALFWLPHCSLVLLRLDKPLDLMHLGDSPLLSAVAPLWLKAAAGTVQPWVTAASLLAPQ